MEKPVNLVSQRLRSSNAWLRQNSLYWLQLLRNMFIMRLHLQTNSRCLSKVACRGERDNYNQENLKWVHWDIRGSLIEGCVKKVMSFLINDKAPNDSPSLHNEEEVEQILESLYLHHVTLLLFRVPHVAPVPGKNGCVWRAGLTGVKSALVLLEYLGPLMSSSPKLWQSLNSKVERSAWDPKKSKDFLDFSATSVSSRIVLLT